MTFRGHCHNVGTNLQHVARAYSRNSVICPCYVFGELNALVRLRCTLAELLRAAIPAEQPRPDKVKQEQRSNMYATKAVNGVPAIQRDGQSVLSVCNQNWEFANWLCALLNELGYQSELLLNEQDWDWLNTNDRAFRRAAHHA
jgi:hypothetical protein